MEGQELLTSDKSGKFITLIKVVSSTPRHGLEVNSVAQLLRLIKLDTYSIIIEGYGCASDSNNTK